MSYASYIPFVSMYCHNFKTANILEVGTEYGTSFISLLHRLVNSNRSFNMVGVDIWIRDSFNATVQSIPRDQEKQRVTLLEANSLDILGHVLQPGRLGGPSGRSILEMPISVALVDGDHNYYTVSKELELIGKYSSPETIIVCDDYSTRYGDKDMFYSEVAEYKHVDEGSFTPRVSLEKEGVRPAVDDFLENNNMWEKLDDPPDLTHDGCLLYRKDNRIFNSLFQAYPDLPVQIRNIQAIDSGNGAIIDMTGDKAVSIIQQLNSAP